MTPRDHWETVYQTKADADLSWFQASPEVSLALISAIRPAPQRVIDVGCGQSALAGALLARGTPHVTVLDISAAAIDRARQRAGPAAARVQWIVGDVLAAPGLGPFDLWHDRAVFHFLSDAEDRRRYVAAAAAAVPAGGHVVVAVFSPSGPEKCSGLPVCRYDATALAGEFGPAFALVGSTTEAHRTPWDKAQDFAYAVLRRT